VSDRGGERADEREGGEAAPRPRTVRDELASMALLVAEEAAALVAGGYRTPVTSGQTGWGEELQRAAAELLAARLSSLSPGIPVMAADAPLGAGGGGARLTWHVAPLDGQVNFDHGHPFWCVAVGLVDGTAPVAGAVVAPALGLRWQGSVAPLAPAEERGAGRESTAMRNGVTCSVSKTGRLTEALVATQLVSARAQLDAFVAVKRATSGIRCSGSAGLDLCFVADGTYEAFWARDVPAGVLAGAGAVVLGAGGALTAVDGGPPDDPEGHVVASNGKVHRALLAAIRS
jgi:myo-inositol-1(or 4)-monophosphatase